MGRRRRPRRGRLLPAAPAEPCGVRPTGPACRLGPGAGVRAERALVPAASADRRVGEPATLAARAPARDREEPRARRAVPPPPAGDPGGERRARGPRPPPGGRERLPERGARPLRRARALAAPPADRAPLGPRRRPSAGRPDPSRALHRGSGSLSPPPARTLRRVAARARRVQRRRAPRRPRAEARARRRLLAARRP